MPESDNNPMTVPADVVFAPILRLTLSPVDTIKIVLDGELKRRGHYPAMLPVSPMFYNELSCYMVENFGQPASQFGILFEEYGTEIFPEPDQAKLEAFFN